VVPAARYQLPLCSATRETRGAITTNRIPATTLSTLAAGDGTPLVVLPGFGRGADLSVRVPRSTALAAVALTGGFRRTVRRANRPVWPPTDMTIAQLAGWHAAALREPFSEPVDVMAVSGGGMTALQMELDHPGTVRRLVLCVAASQASEHARRELLRIVDLEDEGRSSARAGTYLIAHGTLRLILLAASGLSARRPRAPGEAALVRAAQDWDVTGRLGEINRACSCFPAGGTPAPCAIPGGSRRSPPSSPNQPAGLGTMPRQARHPHRGAGHAKPATKSASLTRAWFAGGGDEPAVGRFHRCTGRWPRLTSTGSS
jgi:pimeloyl-ACP methyl ester carboxylesterase